MPLVPARNGVLPHQVSQGSNRLNTQGAELPNVKNRQSLFITNSIAAGAVVPFPISGTEFYVTVCTAPINIRPNAGGSSGSFNSYGQGTGLKVALENAFDTIEIANPNAFPVTFQIFVGFDEYVDKRLYLASVLTPQVAFPTYPTAAAATGVNITDISGNAFTDINGGKWFAISRTSILISNIDAGVTLLVQKAGSVVANGPAIAFVPPLTAIELNVSGNYRLSVGGGNVNAIVSEIYTALAAT